MLVFAIAEAVRADEPSAEQLAEDFIRLGNELVKVLDGVKDREIAERVWLRVDELRAKVKKTRDALEKKPDKEREAAHEAAVEFLGKPADVPAAWERLAQRFPVAADAPLLAEEARGEIATRQTEKLVKACEAFYRHPKSNKRTPDILADLLTPPFGGSSFLKDGQEDLIDPWVSPFQLGISRDAKGNVRFHVWTERTIDGKVRLFGTKPPEEQPTAVQLAKDITRDSNELAKVLDGVKDKEAAEKALPKVEELREKLKKTRDALWKKPDKERFEAYETALESLGTPADVPAAWDRLARRFPVAVDNPVLAEEAHGEVAVIRARTLLTACETYYANPQSGNRYPTGLADLVEPPFGGVSFLKNKLLDVFDSWGVPYKYEVGTARVKGIDGKEYDGPTVYIWTERKIDGKVRVFGTKPPDKKK